MTDRFESSELTGLIYQAGPGYEQARLGIDGRFIKYLTRRWSGHGGRENDRSLYGEFELRTPIGGRISRFLGNTTLHADVFEYSYPQDTEYSRRNIYTVRCMDDLPVAYDFRSETAYNGGWPGQEGPWELDPTITFTVEDGLRCLAVNLRLLKYN